MSSLNRVADIFKNNLVLILPILIALIASLIIGGIITLALFTFTVTAWPIGIFAFSIGAPAITATIGLILAFIMGVAIAVTASMTQDTLASAKPNIQRSWKNVQPKLVPVVILAIIQAVISALLSLIPFVGWILALLLNLLFIPAYILVVTTAQPSLEALSRSIDIIQDFYKKDQNLFIVLIIVALATAIPVVGPIIGIPFIVLSYSYYMKESMPQPIEAQIQFCIKCGARLNSCDRFCGNCGNPVDT